MSKKAGVIGDYEGVRNCTLINCSDRVKRFPVWGRSIEPKNYIAV